MIKVIETQAPSFREKELKSMKIVKFLGVTIYRKETICDQISSRKSP